MTIQEEIKCESEKDIEIKKLERVTEIMKEFDFYDIINKPDVKTNDVKSHMLKYAEISFKIYNKIKDNEAKKIRDKIKQFECILSAKCVGICSKLLFDDKVKYIGDYKIPVYQFNTEFVSIPTKSHQLKVNCEIGKKIKKMKQPLMWLLLNEYYPKYNKNDLKMLM